MFYDRCKASLEHIFHCKTFPQVGSSYKCMQYQLETVLWDLNVSVKTWFVVHGPKAITQSRQEVKFYQPLLWRPQASPGKRKSTSQMTSGQCCWHVPVIPYPLQNWLNGVKILNRMGVSESVYGLNVYFTSGSGIKCSDSGGTLCLDNHVIIGLQPHEK